MDRVELFLWHVQQGSDFICDEIADGDDGIGPFDRVADLSTQKGVVFRLHGFGMSKEADIMNRDDGFSLSQRRASEVGEMVDIGRSREPVERRPVESLPAMLYPTPR